MATGEKQLTGRTVLIITVSAFAIILAANLTLAISAIGTFPGLETRNSYVASQNFDADRAAQRALGWQVAASLTATGDLALAIRDVEGAPVRPELVSATLGRATHVRDDRQPEFAWNGTEFLAPVDLAPGNWNLRLQARADDGTLFRQRIVLHVRE